jgi:hypothetical protein
MPFDPAPREVKVGKYQHMADAMLRGCAVTKPITGCLIDGKGGACAMGALSIGLGRRSITGALLAAERVDPIMGEMWRKYFCHYGDMIQSDNDTGRFTREQIAARIAAL